MALFGNKSKEEKTAAAAANDMPPMLCVQFTYIPISTKQSQHRQYSFYEINGFIPHLKSPLKYKYTTFSQKNQTEFSAEIFAAR